MSLGTVDKNKRFLFQQHFTLSSFTENLKNWMVLVKKQEKSLLACSSGCIKTAAIGLNLRNELLNHRIQGNLDFHLTTKPKATLQFSLNHQSMPWEETNTGKAGRAQWVVLGSGQGVDRGSCFAPAQVSWLSGVRWGVASPEHLQEDRLFLMLLSLQPEVGEAEHAAVESWQGNSVQPTVGIYCNPVKPVIWTDPSSPTVSLCVFPYLQRSSSLEKSEIHESIPPLSFPQLHPLNKVSVRCFGLSLISCPLPTHSYV